MDAVFCYPGYMHFPHVGIPALDFLPVTNTFNQ
jgi:hypothetical protein